LSPPGTTGGAIARAAAEVGQALGAKYLVAFTQSGDTARRLARYRSPIPVLAFTPTASVRSVLSLTWGVETFLVLRRTHGRDGAAGRPGAAGTGQVPARRHRVIVAGSPPGIPGSTNAMRVHQMGDAVSQVAPGYQS
jgi:pyruvate kinase